MKLILASASPRRKEILATLGLPFEVIPADIPENIFHFEDARSVALEKARFIASSHPDSVVLGADTIVVQDQIILGKPDSLQHAKAMIQALSGKTHSVYTGVALVRSVQEIEITDLIETRVTVQEISGREIERYLSEEHVLDAAGAYKIQGGFSRFIDRIEGDYWNVVGLPLSWVYQNLKFFFPF
jgi:septum formation protein